MRGHSVTSQTAGSDQSVPRHGSIYDRLDKARAQRLKSLSPQVPANDAPSPKSASQRTPSKMHLLPSLKTQEAFDVPMHSGTSAIGKLGIAILALSILAGFALFDRGSGGPQTSITAPAQIAPEVVQTSLPVVDEPERASGTLQIEEASAGSLPVIPAAPSDAMAVEVQQVTAPLSAPDASTLESAKSP